MTQLRRSFTSTFTLADIQRANDAWGANCGPGALAAILAVGLQDVRPLIVGFEERRYTNPSMMLGALERSARPFRKVWPISWPLHGLARIQWHGPWMAEGVPMGARYRQTHWVGTAQMPGRGVGIFDVNAMLMTPDGTGWVTLRDWEATVVPYILRECVPRADGVWSLTHVFEVEPKAGG